MAKSETSISATAKFNVADFLTSRTDKRGMIQAANEIFRSVSGHPWEELRDASHDIIRHQDTPKGVFWLFWSTLHNNEPIGAFIKNMSASGEPYWVFVVATPLEDGYFSIQLKPQGKLFDNIVSIYSKVLLAEQSEDLTPEESGSALVKHIQELGFRDYKTFMTKAIVEQIALRDIELKFPENTTIAHLAKAVNSWENVAIEIHKTIEAFAKFERLPVNMRIQATHLSDAGNAFGVIAGNFTTLTEQIEELISNLLKMGAALEKTLLESLFITCIKQVQTEAIDIFHKEDVVLDGVNKATEISIIDVQNNRFEATAIDGLKEISGQVYGFNSMFSSIKTLHSGIAVMRVTADIEISQIKNLQTASLSAIVEGLEEFLQTEGDRLTRMMDGTSLVQREIKLALDDIGKNRTATVIQGNGFRKAS